jgi:hypothetical protein
MAYAQEKEFGVQPLDSIMNRFEIKNTDLVKASTEQLSHKMVAKGRSGRRLGFNVQTKILTALRKLHPEEAFSMKDIFNY